MNLLARIQAAEQRGCYGGTYGGCIACGQGMLQVVEEVEKFSEMSGATTVVNGVCDHCGYQQNRGKNSPRLLGKDGFMVHSYGG